MCLDKARARSESRAVGAFSPNACVCVFILSVWLLHAVHDILFGRYNEIIKTGKYAII